MAVSFQRSSGATMSTSQFLKVTALQDGGKAGAKGKAPTPFTFFKAEMKQVWQREGKWDGQRSTDKQLAEALQPLWSDIKEEPSKMAVYIEQHRQWKLEARSDLDNVFDTMGLGDINRAAVKQRKELADMEKEIEDTVAGLGQVGVTGASFFVGHFNYLCKTDREFYPPCEMAVAEFSLERGVIRVFHEFVSPLDSVPVGHKYKCQQHARVTHNLLPEFEYYQKDYRVLMTGLIAFLGGAGPAGSKLPPIYVAPRHKEAAECIAEFLVQRSAAVRQLRLFSLPKLMLELRNLPLAAGAPEYYPSQHVAQSVLEEDKWSHHAGIGCEFHEALENPHHCSVAIVRRLVFDLASGCCVVYRLALRAGRHLPPDQELTRPDVAAQLRWSGAPGYVKAESLNRSSFGSDAGHVCAGLSRPPAAPPRRSRPSTRPSTSSCATRPAASTSRGRGRRRGWRPGRWCAPGAGAEHMRFSPLVKYDLFQAAGRRGGQGGLPKPGHAHGRRQLGLWRGAAAADFSCDFVNLWIIGSLYY